MKLRIVKNMLNVIKKTEEVEILSISSNQLAGILAKNLKTLDKKGHFIAKKVKFQEQF